MRSVSCITFAIALAASMASAGSTTVTTVSTLDMPTPSPTMTTFMEITTMIEIFNPGSTSLPLDSMTASVIDSNNGALTVACDCTYEPSVPGCMLKSPITVTQGPSTFSASAEFPSTLLPEMVVEATLNRKCDITASTEAACSISRGYVRPIGGGRETTVFNTTYKGSDMVYAALPVMTSFESSSDPETTLPSSESEATLTFSVPETILTSSEFEATPTFSVPEITLTSSEPEATLTLNPEGAQTSDVVVEITSQSTSASTQTSDPETTLTLNPEAAQTSGVVVVIVSESASTSTGTSASTSTWTSASTSAMTTTLTPISTFTLAPTSTSTPMSTVVVILTPDTTTLSTSPSTATSTFTSTSPSRSPKKFAWTTTGSSTWSSTWTSTFMSTSPPSTGGAPRATMGVAGAAMALAAAIL